MVTSTDEYGEVRLVLYTVDRPMKDYAASTQFTACLETDWVPQERKFQIEMNPLACGDQLFIEMGQEKFQICLAG